MEQRIGTTSWLAAVLKLWIGNLGILLAATLIYTLGTLVTSVLHAIPVLGQLTVLGANGVLFAFCTGLLVFPRKDGTSRWAQMQTKLDATRILEIAVVGLPVAVALHIGDFLKLLSVALHLSDDTKAAGYVIDFLWAIPASFLLARFAGAPLVALRAGQGVAFAPMARWREAGAGAYSKPLALFFAAFLLQVPGIAAHVLPIAGPVAAHVFLDMPWTFALAALIARVANGEPLAATVDGEAGTPERGLWRPVVTALVLVAAGTFLAPKFLDRGDSSAFFRNDELAAPGAGAAPSVPGDGTAALAARPENPVVSDGADRAAAQLSAAEVPPQGTQPEASWEKPLYAAPVWGYGTALKELSAYAGGPSKLADNLLFGMATYTQPCARKFAAQQHYAGDVFPFADVVDAMRAYVKALPAPSPVYRRTMLVDARPYDFDLGALGMDPGLWRRGAEEIVDPFVDTTRYSRNTGSFWIRLYRDPTTVLRSDGSDTPFPGQCGDYQNRSRFDWSTDAFDLLLGRAPGFPFIMPMDRERAREITPVIQANGNQFLVDLLFTIEKLQDGYFWGDVIGGAVFADREREVLITTWGEADADRLGTKPPLNEQPTLVELELDLDFPTYE